MSEPLSDLKKLCKRIEEMAEEHHLTAAQISLIPTTGDRVGPDQIVVTFLISEEAVEDEAQAEKRKLDAEFDALVGGAFKKSTVANPIDGKLAEKVDDMEETLRKWQNGE